MIRRTCNHYRCQRGCVNCTIREKDGEWKRHARIGDCVNCGFWDHERHVGDGGSVMNDLLRMANEVTETIENMWADERLSITGCGKVCDVIKGYQDLVRRMVDVYMNTSWDDLSYGITPLMKEAMASIPREQSNE